jgi:rSAM/selenodomain-associated transferase 1
MTRALVLAKAPVAGRVKTRLGADVGMAYAAELAAAALLDSLEACSEAFGPGACWLSLSGDLAAAVRADELADAVRGWTVVPQRGEDFGERLVNAHLDAGTVEGAVVQIGMDTPQVTAADLAAVADGLVEHEAVLGDAPDGGWWVLGLRRPDAAAALRGVPMSTPTTGADTRAALEAAGLTVGATAELSDVDTIADADEVAALPPTGRFATAWRGRTR